MRNTFFAVVIQTVFLFCCSGSVLAIDHGETEVTVYSLQKGGWEIAEKKVCQELRPGIAPYQFLHRVLSVTTYWLHFENEEIICHITYDSQLDRQDEKCGERHLIPESMSRTALLC